MAKHIVIDARSRPSSTGRYVDRLIQHLQFLDKENLYTILLKPDDNWKPTAQNFVTKSCDFKQFSFNPLDQITFAKYLRRLEADLIHFAMTPQEPVFYTGKRVTTTHDLTMLRFARPGKLPAVLHAVRMAGYRRLFKSSHDKSEQIIVPSEFVRQDLIKHDRSLVNKITVTYEASEPPISSQASALQNVSKPFIFHVGSPFPHKNIERLIEVFEILHAEKPELQLILPGKKEFYFDKLQKQIDRSPAKNKIVVPGFISDEELKWLYQNASAYVLPSLSEGFGLPGLEAMAHGCPLVSSNATCLPEVFGNAAHYFDPVSIGDMASKIKEVIDNEQLRNELISNGSVQIAKYSWRRMAEQTLKVYLDVIK